MVRHGGQDDGERSALQAALGDVYELTVRLGRGGFGTVYAGRHRILERPVAIKVIKPDLGYPNAESAFAREARLLANLDHPHIVTAHDFFERDGRWFLVMEQMSGGALRPTAVSTPEAAVAVVLAAADALHHAHTSGLLHRDVKPANILLAAGGQPKVGDLGIAKAITGTDTQVSQVIGTPAYMAPEQLSESGRISAATDVYALAIVLYELLERRQPFQGDNDWQRAASKLRGELAPPAQTPRRLASVVLRALSLDVADRPTTAREFAVELAGAAANGWGADWLSRSGIPLHVHEQVRHAATVRPEPKPRPEPRPGPEEKDNRSTPDAPDAPDAPPAGEADPPADGKPNQPYALPPGSARRLPREQVVSPVPAGWRTGKELVVVNLGSRRCVVSVLEDGRPTVVENAEGSLTTPSVVAFTTDGEILVGGKAARQAVVNLERTVRSPLAHLGTGWTLRVDGEEYLPQQILAFLLADLVSSAESRLGTRVGSAVVCVPASFGYEQRRAVVEAAAIAGITVIRVVPATVAAGLAFARTRSRSESATALVFSLGARSLDVSVLEIGDGVVEIRSTAVDDELGGDDFDQRIVNHVLRTSRREHRVDLSRERTTLQRVREAAEKAKIELSQSSQATINLPYIMAPADGPPPAGGPLHLDVPISRAEFQGLTADLLDRCRQPFRQALAAAGVRTRDLDHVVLVGGATRMPAVVDLLRRLTGGKEPSRGVNPDEAVAVGAGLQAGVLRGDVRDFLVLDATPHALRVEIADGETATVVERNAALPVRRSQLFTTAEDNQPSVRIRIFHGDRATAADNRMLGELELTGLAPAPRGEPRVQVTIDIDPNGVVHASAKDEADGHAAWTTLVSAAALPDDEIERMSWVVRHWDAAHQSTLKPDAARRDEANRDHAAPGGTPHGGAPRWFARRRPGRGAQ